MSIYNYYTNQLLTFPGHR